MCAKVRSTASLGPISVILDPRTKCWRHIVPAITWGGEPLATTSTATGPGGLLMHPSLQLSLRLPSYCFGPHVHLALARAWWIRLLTLDQPVCH